MNDEAGVPHLTGVMFIRTFIFSLHIFKPHPSAPWVLILHVKAPCFFTAGERGSSPTHGERSRELRPNRRIKTNANLVPRAFHRQEWDPVLLSEVKSPGNEIEQFSVKLV